MELLGLDIANLLIGAVSGLVGSVLTYLATRRQQEVSERSVYISAVENLTASLRAEIERVNTDRLELLGKIEAMEARIAELEANERTLKSRIEELAQEREQLVENLRRHLNGGEAEGAA